MPRPNTQEQFARLVGISQPEVSQLIRKGVLSRGAKAGVWLQEYLKNLRAIAAQHKSADGLDLIAERARLSARQAEKLEIELAQLRNELLPAQSIAELLQNDHATIRTKLLALPSRVRSLAAGMAPKHVDIIDRVVRETLDQLSHEHFPARIREIAEQYFSVLHTSAETNGKPVGGQLPDTKSRKQRRAR